MKLQIEAFEHPFFAVTEMKVFELDHPMDFDEQNKAFALDFQEKKGAISGFFKPKWIRKNPEKTNSISVDPNVLNYLPMKLKWSEAMFQSQLHSINNLLTNANFYRR